MPEQTLATTDGRVRAVIENITLSMDGGRARAIAPRLAGMRRGGKFEIEGAGLLRVGWELGDGTRLHLLANLQSAASASAALPPGEILYASANVAESRAAREIMPAWSVACSLEAV